MSWNIEKHSEDGLGKNEAEEYSVGLFCDVIAGHLYENILTPNISARISLLR